MAKDKLPAVWPIEPHTAAKHDLLRTYLGGWYPIMSRHNGRVIFLDGFAGPGSYSGGEPGSPRIALTTLLEHQYDLSKSNCEFRLLFNEVDPARFAELKAAVGDLEGAGWPAHVRVSVHNEEFTELAEKMLGGLTAAQRLAPTFAFLDPFGYRDVPIDLIRKLLSFAKCELSIYFDYNSVNRFAQAGIVDQHFDALFGTDEYKQAPRAGHPGRHQFLHDLYARQLQAVCGFDYVQSFEMINRQGRTGNYMFFCTRSLKGLEVMKEQMWKLDPTGAFRFSDRLAGVNVLFQPEVDTRPLQHVLMAHFAGQRLDIQAISDWVLINTPYARSHVKRKTLAVLQRNGRITSPNQARANSYPDGTLIDFS